MIEYVEEFRKDTNIPSIPLQIIGWFMGFTPRGAHDLVATNLPRFTDDPVMTRWQTVAPGTLKRTGG